MGNNDEEIIEEKIMGNNKEEIREERGEDVYRKYREIIPTRIRCSWDMFLDRQLYLRDLIDTLQVPLTDTATVTFFNKDGTRQYKIRKQPQSVDVMLFQLDGKEKDSNSKVHIHRDLDGIINWLSVGPINDRTKKHKKNYSRLDLFIKRLDSGLTITRIDDEIRKALALEYDFSWMPPRYHQEIKAITQEFPLKMARLKYRGKSFPRTVLKKGIELYEAGNEKFRFYQRRYDAFDEALRLFCSRICVCKKCGIEQLTSIMLYGEEALKKIIEKGKNVNYLKIYNEKLK